MKLKKTPFVIALISSACIAANATEVVWSGATDAVWSTPTNWVGDVAPAAIDTAVFNATSTANTAVSLTAATTVAGLKLDNAGAAVSISGALNLTAGVLTTDGTNGLTVQNGTSAFNITSLNGAGSVTINKSNTINWTGAGTLDAADDINFNGTLTLRGGTGSTSPASVAGSWTAIGGAACTQAAGTAFALDTGNSVDTGSGAGARDLIVADGFTGSILNLTSLSGYGAIRCDWGGAAGTITRTVRVNQATDTTFNGLFLSHHGTASRIRNLALIKDGVGKLTMAGLVGRQTASAGGSSDQVPITLNAGTLVLTANNTRNGAATIASGATLQAGNGGTTGTIGGSTVTNDGSLVFDYGTGASVTISNVISGSGSIAKNGDGEVVFSGTSSSFAGPVDLNAGSLRIGPNLGSGTLTVKTGTFISSGLTASNGTSQVGALVLEDATESDFRLGATNDKIVVAGALTAPASGIHTINLFEVPTAGGTIKLIDYSGTALTGTEFSRFDLGLLPGGTATFSLVNNTADTSIDLLITLEDQVWKGSTDGNWDASTTNWALASAPGTPVAFSLDNPAVFDDTAAIYAVVVDAGGVNPLSTTFNNSANAYTLTGGDIYGTTGVVKNGIADVTLAQTNSYTGGTTVNAGTLVFTGASNTSTGGVTVNGGKLQIGAGGTEGDIGSGAVAVATGASLEFNRSNVTPGTADFDYKTTAKMRNVSGTGDIVLTGGAMLFNYTGSGVGFADANSWAGFSGDLIIKGGSEFQTIRNGATAMGTGNVILGDGGSSGSLSQIEGNWTWTNNISLVGANNKILSRSAGSLRSLKLQGVISGSGGLSFEDPALAMNNANRGFILTGANTLNGSLTIATGTPVRVGGVPGNDASLNVGGSGSLGSATVVNNGTLTFSRIDAHSVANDISGTGAVRVGIPTLDGYGDTSTQVVSLSGANSYAGATTVANSTLAVDGDALPNAGSLVIELGGVVQATGTEVVDTLFIEGTQQASGTWGASGSGADHIDDVHFSGTAGVISVTTGGALPDYDTWLALYTFGGGDDTTPTGDPDGDGLTNQEEYAFGLDPTSGASVSPITVGLDKSAGTFTYTRRDDALTTLTYKVWTSEDLSGWTEDTGSTQDDTIGVPDGNGVESVLVTLTTPPTAPKLFVRVTAQ